MVWSSLQCTQRPRRTTRQALCAPYRLADSSSSVRERKGEGQWVLCDMNLLSLAVFETPKPFPKQEKHCVSRCLIVSETAVASRAQGRRGRGRGSPALRLPLLQQLRNGRLTGESHSFLRWLHRPLSSNDRYVRLLDHRRRGLHHDVLLFRLRAYLSSR